MREYRTSGSVEGVVGNHDPYSDRTGLQEQDSNHLPLLLSKGSGGERRRKRPRKRNSGQVTSRERNESEPLPCRKERDDVETTVVRRSWE